MGLDVQALPYPRLSTSAAKIYRANRCLQNIPHDRKHEIRFASLIIFSDNASFHALLTVVLQLCNLCGSLDETVLSQNPRDPVMKSVRAFARISDPGRRRLPYEPQDP